jgi:hypothetical protein
MSLTGVFQIMIGDPGEGLEVMRRSLQKGRGWGGRREERGGRKVYFLGTNVKYISSCGLLKKFQKAHIGLGWQTFYCSPSRGKRIDYTYLLL